ncbi:DUF5719 family protein [Bifidobacterium biavatii]|uniref:Organic solvents resistance ABC transporter permease n=1 Tax=Bifidobacterium biavatii DSM 23969 TaxID=1437608 RepID=A0A086ZUK2_9BIFI|nr:DUF5719 family protein [Bifidobacterium biavatii]KFI50202.1 hypothetical protein BBIA_1685 [Bifidobacterium biavatii DSM 23969]
MTKQRTVRRHAARRGLGVAFGTLAMLVVVSLFAAMTIIRPLPGLADGTGANGGSSSQTVSQLQLQSYCPARMSLADNGTYGDSAYQATAGDIASSARYAAFGSVYRASIGTLADSGSGTALKGSSKDETVLAGEGNVDDMSTLLSTRLLESKTGTGAAASVASWATKGDLRGVSAASCVTPALSHGFLLPSTGTGTTQQLVLANPSAKSTTVQVRAWGTDGKLSLSTAESVTIKAKGETVTDLSAAAGGQDALYVTVSSEQTPVAAVVRVVSIDGLTPQGSDYAVPANAARATSVMPGIEAGEHVHVIAYSGHDASVNLSWITEHGLSTIGKQELQGGRTAMFDLDAAPKDALGVLATADTRIMIAAQTAKAAGDGQADFALIRSEAADKSSAIAVPGDMTATLTVANPTTSAAAGTLRAYDANGSLVGERSIELQADSAQAVTMSDIGKTAAIIRLDVTDGDLAWGARLASAAVDKAKAAGVAYLSASPLAELTERIWANQNPTVVR